ncbi:MAG: tripartite tricarboxylate transporter TctB family protein [Acetobacteraceae bacterium]|nr:tripartite tricarboxylate transporter TctB family protein [Acetobacteraceae bacterium]
MIRLRNAQDLAAGGVLILVAVLAMVFADNLPMGRLMNMGSGFVPVWLARLLGLIGLIVAARAFTIDGPKLEIWAWQPLIALTCSIMVFAFLLERAGLAIAVMITVAVSRVAAPGIKFLEVLMLGGVLAAGSVALFTYGLGLPLRAWPEFGG